MKGQGGIQMLLTAEQEAQQIIASARNSKLPTFILPITDPFIWANANSEAALFDLSPSSPVPSFNNEKLRLRQAKEEAEREAAAYRAYLEEEYQRTVSERSGYSGSNVKRLETETEAKIGNLKKMSANVKSDVAKEESEQQAADGRKKLAARKFVGGDVTMWMLMFSFSKK
ncbi:hypothetical protein ACLOJK_016813 [Asimina triloba]